MKRPPEVTDDEIKQFMDFDQVLQKRNAVVRKHLFLKYGLAITAVAVLTGILFYAVKTSEPASTQTTSQTKDTIVRHESNLPESTPLPPEAITDQQPDHDTEIRVNPVVQKQQQPPVPKPAAPVADAAVAESVYIQAEPVVGYDSLFAYFRSQLQYPKEAVGDSVQGVLTVSFVINRKGNVDHIEFLKSPGAAFEREALRLIEKMPTWKPASLNGKPVNSKVSLPFTFELRKVQ